MILIATIVGGFTVAVGLIVAVAHWTRPLPAACGTCGAEATTHAESGVPLCQRCARRWFPGGGA